MGWARIPKPNVSRQVLSADQIPQIKAHPLDEKLKHMPTWQEQMLNPDGDVPELSESDDSDEDEDSEEANLRRQRKQEEKERAKKEAEAKRAAEEEESSVESDEDEDWPMHDFVYYTFAGSTHIDFRVKLILLVRVQ